MSRKSSLLTNEALDRLFGYTKTNFSGGTTESDPTDVFLKQIPPSSGSQLNNLFGDIATEMSPVQSSIISEITPDNGNVSMQTSNIPIVSFDQAEANRKAFENRERQVTDNRARHEEQIRQAELNREKQAELNRIKHEEQIRQAELNKLKREEEMKQAELNKLRQAEEVRVASLYNKTSHEVYHIVIDSVCSLDLTTIKPYTHGHMRAYNKQAGKIPVTFDLSDAEEIAKKIVTEIDKRGSSSTNAYPIFGAIILKLNINDVQSRYADVYKGGAKRDYGLLAPHAGEKIVVYNAGGKTRGLLDPSLLSSAKLQEIKYVVAFDVPEHIGFGMLNGLKLKHTDIYHMKQAYKAGLSGNSHRVEQMAKQSLQYVPQEQPVSHINQETVEQPIGILTGGSNIDYKKMYENEKATYLKLKALVNKAK